MGDEARMRRHDLELASPQLLTLNGVKALRAASQLLKLMLVQRLLAGYAIRRDYGALRVSHSI